MTWDIRFKTPFNKLLSGISQAGKTTYVKNLLQMGNELFTTKPDFVILFYKAMQPIYEEMQNENLIHKLININTENIDLNEIYEMIEPYAKKNGSMLIFDDILTDITKEFEELFCNVSHHKNCSIIFLTQNLFYNDKAFRTMSLNSHYIVIMKNPRDSQQVSILARQIRPDNPNYIIHSYMEATKKQYSYLIFDFSPNSSCTIKLRNNIFPSENPVQIFLEK